MTYYIKKKKKTIKSNFKINFKNWKSKMQNTLNFLLLIQIKF